MSFFEELRHRNVFRVGSTGVNGGISIQQKPNWMLLKFVKFVVNNLIAKSPQKTSSTLLCRRVTR